MRLHLLAGISLIAIDPRDDSVLPKVTSFHGKLALFHKKISK